MRFWDNWKISLIMSGINLVSALSLFLLETYWIASANLFMGVYLFTVAYRERKKDLEKLKV